MTALLESLTALLEYFDLLQFSIFTEAVASVASMVATPLDDGTTVST